MAGSGGHKAVLAISGDNESAVIKYRSEQDMASICEYSLVLEWADGNSKTRRVLIQVRLESSLNICNLGKRELNMIGNIWNTWVELL